MTLDELNKILAQPGYAVAGGKAPRPKLERSLGDGPLATGQAEKGDTGRVLIRVVSHRRRLLDEDNLSEKYFVDCARYAGLLAGDEPAKTKIEVSQEKVSRKEDERTEIQITPCP